jgi:sugar lactone lactonase YvrE
VTESPNADIGRYASERRKRGRTVRLVLLVLLVLLLMLLAWSAMYYIANRRLPFPPVQSVAGSTVAAPEFLYAISGPEGGDSLEKPVGVAVTADDKVFVVDSKARVVRSYFADGRYRFSFNAIESSKGSTLGLPARVTIGPDGNVWVTDRRLGAVFVFDPDTGAYVRELVPQGDLAETWRPIALAFNAEGVLYTADLGLSKNHQIVAFDTDGREVARWGTTVQTTTYTQSPGGFYYPNGIAFASNGDVFVTDMSNHRIQVFSPEGEYKYLIASSGSPLGIAIDPEQRIYVVDPFAHQVDIYELDGKRITGFGGPGLALGRFRFPSDIALDESGRMFVSDRENNQVQVWGWPSGIIPPIELPDTPTEWLFCLSPLLLLLIPLLRRRVTFMTTGDFIESMIAIESVPKMDDRKFRWIVTERLWEQYSNLASDGVRFEDLLRGEAYSRTDVDDMIEKSGVDEATAIVLTMAERAGRLATEDPALAEAAGTLGIEVVNRERFLREYAARRRSDSARRER